MLAVVPPLRTQSLRCARIPFQTKLSPNHQRQCTRIRDGLLTRHFSLTAPVAKRRHEWNEAEDRKLVDYTNVNYISEFRQVDWKNVGSYMKTTPEQCKCRFYQKHGVASKYVDSGARRGPRENTPRRETHKDWGRSWTSKDITRLRTSVANSLPTDKWEDISQYIGNGRSKCECRWRWGILCDEDEMATFLDPPGSPAVPRNDETVTIYNVDDNWTSVELWELKTLLKSPPSGHGALLNAAFAIFPQKPHVYVYTRLKQVMKFPGASTKRQSLSEMWHRRLERMVNDYGGANKADWEEIGKTFGLSKYRCQGVYNTIAQAGGPAHHWTTLEESRLVAALRGQSDKDSDSYDWDAAAAAVETRNSKQCKRKFESSKRIKKKLLNQTVPPPPPPSSSSADV